MQYSEAWMPGVPLPYCTSADVQRSYAHLAPPGDVGMGGWSPPTMGDMPGPYLQQAYMPIPDYRQAAAAGLSAYPPMFDYSQLTEAQLTAHLSSSQPPPLAPPPGAPQLLSVNPRPKMSLGPHRGQLQPVDDTGDDDEDDALLAGSDHMEGELPTTAGPSHSQYFSKAPLQAAAAAGQLPYGPALQQYRPYPQLRHAPPALVPYHAYPYPNPLSQPHEFDDTPPHDPSLAASPPVMAAMQPSLSRPGPSNAEVAQQLGDDIADHFVRVERKITCPTYCKRLHVTQFMAENLLPTDQNKDRAKGPLCYNYECLFKHKIWLIDEDLVSWPVEYEGVVCCAQRHYRLTSGWRNFVRAKNIKVGDTVVMERRGRNRHNVYVRVVEGTGPTPATPPKAKGPRLKATLARNDDTLGAPDASLASP